MSKIPTAKMYLEEHCDTQGSPKHNEFWADYVTPDILINFAKFHVKAALKAASKKAYVEYIDLKTNEIFDYTDVITDDDVGASVNKESIINAYSLTNIK